MSKPGIAFVGIGFVGGSLAQVFAEKEFSVITYDKANSTIKDFHMICFSLNELVVRCENNTNFSGIYFVCLPTPMRQDDGSCDTSIVEGVLKDLSSKVTQDSIAVVKSTVPPGFTERWNKELEGTKLTVIHNPEFLREATALDDMRNQDRIILGGPRPHVDKVRDLFRMAFPDVPIHKTGSSISEMVKYTANCFLATKVSFANELFQVVEGLQQKGLDVDYDRVVELAKLDKRLGDSHWQVPSRECDENGKPYRGYGLSCFPKDVNEFVFLAKQLGVDPKVIEAGWKKNLEVRPERDYLLLKGRAVSEK